MRTFRAVALFAMVVFLSACAGGKPEQPPVAAPATPALPPPGVSPAAKPPAPAPPPPPPTPLAEPPRPVSPPPAPVPPPERILHIKTDLANFREGPGTKAKILRVLRKGTPVTVLEEKDQWFRVRLEDGREGWIAESVAAQ